MSAIEVSGRKQVGSDDVRTGILCDPCKGEDDEENAVFYCTVCNEFLCKTCAKVHGKLTVSKNHRLLDRGNMPKQKLKSSEESMCTKHNDKLVEFYCRIHEVCCCSVCATKEHTQCNVEYIDDTAIEYEISKEYTSLKIAIAALNQRLHSTKRIALKNKEDVGHIHKLFVSELKKFRSEINQVLDCLEQHSLMEAKTVREKDTKATESVSTTCDSMMADLVKMSSNMEKQKEYKQQRQLVISAKKAQNDVKQFESITTELDSQCEIEDYRFRANDTIFQSLKAVNSLGNLENKMKKEGVTKIENKVKTSAPSKPVSLRYVDIIDIQHSTDTHANRCGITGGVMLHNNMLALTDRNNSSVKIVDVINNKVISCIKLPTRPWDITRVEQDQIVVTCDNKLVFIKVGETLSVMKEVVIGRKSRGIVYTNNTFICSFKSPGCLKIIDLGGKILKTITTDIRRQRLFAFPGYIVLSRDQKTLYVSDYDNHSVTSMDLDGNVQHVYKHDKLMGPRGLAVDREDNIYIAGCGSHNIHIISPQCTTIRVVRDGTPGMKYPYAVIHSERDNRLYIGNKKVNVYQIE